MSGGGPAYKPQEDYYDEIIELKKVASMHSCCFDSHSYTLQRSRLGGGAVVRVLAPSIVAQVQFLDPASYVSGLSLLLVFLLSSRGFSPATSGI